MAEYSEDGPPNVPPAAPRGILSETVPTVGLGESQMGEQMAPEDRASDAETVHAESMMEAFKAGDVQSLRDSMAAFVRECVRNYDRGNK